jgi:VCBS repeat protein
MKNGQAYRAAASRLAIVFLALVASMAWAPAAGAVTLSSPATFAAGIEPNAVAIAKLNGDSYLDLVTVNESSQSVSAGAVSILLGGPGGTFGAPTSFAVGILPDAVTVTHVNGDSNLDLVVANQTSDDISVLFGAGNGTFTTPATALINDLDGITAADTTITVDTTTGFPASGLVRIDAEVIHCAGKTATTFTTCTRGVSGTAPAIHADRSAVSMTPAGDAPTATAVGDFNSNADSYPDIAVTNENSNTVSILLGGPGGSFASMSTIPVGTAPQSILTSDFNGDSKIDLVLANEAPNSSTASVMVLLGAGNGTFTLKTNIAYGTRRPTAVEVSDFNGDSRIDFAVANYASSDFSVWLGNGDGTFTATTNPVLAAGSQPVAIAVGDFNRDFIPDLTMANEGTNNVSIVLGTGTGTFGSPVNFALPPGSGPQAIAVGNLDGNSFEDLALANKLQNVAGVFFEVPPDTTANSGPPALSNDTTPIFTFASNDGASTFQCKLDGGSFGACSGSQSHSPTISSDGPHTFQVRAVYAGHVDPTPATWSFTIDTVPPPTPTLKDSEPASPANNNAPLIRGSAAAGSTVTLYTTADCTGSAAATGPASTFNGSGLPVGVADNSTTEFYATASDEFADGGKNVSGCSTTSVTYVEETPPPPPDPDPVPPPAGGGPPGPVGPPDPGTPIHVDVTAPSMTVIGKALKLKTNGAVSLALTCPASEPGGCAGRVSIDTVVQVRAGKRKVKLGTGSFRIAGGKSGAVKLRLSSKNRALVKRLRRVRVLVTIDARDQVGNARTSRQSLTLKVR